MTHVGYTLDALDVIHAAARGSKEALGDDAPEGDELTAA